MRTVKQEIELVIVQATGIGYHNVDRHVDKILDIFSGYAPVMDEAAMRDWEKQQIVCYQDINWIDIRKAMMDAVRKEN